MDYRYNELCNGLSSVADALIDLDQSSPEMMWALGEVERLFGIADDLTRDTQQDEFESRYLTPTKE